MRARVRWRAAAAIAVAAACGGSGDAPPAAVGAPLRIMSFNIRYGTADDGDNAWDLRRDLVVRVIHDAAPDVLGVQEALRFQLEEIRRGLPAFAEVGVGRDDGATQGEYAAILYLRDRFDLEDQGTFWLSDTPATAGSRSWGNRIPRICTWVRLFDRVNGRSVWVYNVHFDHESQPSRERSVELLARRVAGRPSPDPVVVLGDFNAGEDNPVMQFVVGAVDRVRSDGSPPPLDLVDTYRALHPDSAAVGTFHGFAGTTDGDKIDGIYASPSFIVSRASIVRERLANRYPSDHYPVLTVLRFP